MKIFALTGRVSRSLFSHKNFTVAGTFASLLLVFCCQIASAQNDWVAPGDNLEVSGIPKVPSALAQTVKRYTRAYGLLLAGWDVTKREVWLKNITGSSASLYRVGAPGGTSQPFTYIPVGGVYDVYPAPLGRYLVYNSDTSGNEAFQMYLYDLETHKSTPLTDSKSRNTEPIWSNKGDRIIYSD